MGNNLQMKRMVFLLAVCAALSGVWGAEAGHRLGVPWWKARLAEKEAQAQTHHDTVFIGDSITHNWDNLAPDLQKQYFGDVLNLGFSGDRTHEVLWRIRRIDWAKVAPKRIMLMIGTNNAGTGVPPEETFEGIRAIVDHLKTACPDATIMILKIFPRGNDEKDGARRLNDAVNARLHELADGKRVLLRDVSPFYFMPDGKTLNRALVPDLLRVYGLECRRRRTIPRSNNTRGTVTPIKIG